MDDGLVRWVVDVDDVAHWGAPPSGRECLQRGRVMTPNGLEMSRLAVSGDVPRLVTRCTGPVPSAQDQLRGNDTPTGKPESTNLALASGLRRPGRLHRVVRQPV